MIEIFPVDYQCNVKILKFLLSGKVGIDCGLVSNEVARFYGDNYQTSQSATLLLLIKLITSLTYHSSPKDISLIFNKHLL